MDCAFCREAILEHDDRADTVGTDAHRECALRNVLGGIGHLLDHSHFCHGPLGTDAGLDRRTSALLVEVYIARKGMAGYATGVRPDITL